MTNRRLDQNHSANSIRAGAVGEMSLTHVPLKNTKFQVSLCGRWDVCFVRTTDAMFLHSSYFFKREAGRIYHESEFCRIDPLKFIIFYGDDEKDKKDQIAEFSQT